MKTHTDSGEEFQIKALLYPLPDLIKVTAWTTTKGPLSNLNGLASIGLLNVRFFLWVRFLGNMSVMLFYGSGFREGKGKIDF